MATNEQLRRQSGARMEASRRATGQANQDSRRAGDAAMRERRTGRSEVNDLNALADPPRQRRTLAPVEPRGGLPSRVGTGTYQAPPIAGGGGGIASPLTETAYADRTHWADATLISTDGLLSFKVKPIKALTMTDANGAEVVQQFANPAVTP
ncbi:hypothetical protein D9M68_254090 [compost metagenome]